VRLLDIHSYDQVITVITKYYPLERFPPKSLYALEELLPKTSCRSEEGVHISRGFPGVVGQAHNGAPNPVELAASL
jgi:hypothetical protein